RAVTHFPVVVAESGVVQISIKLPRHHEMVGAIDGALEQAPEVFDAIRVDVAAHVLFGVLDHLVRILIFQPKTKRASVIGKRSEPVSMFLRMNGCSVAPLSSLTVFARTSPWRESNPNTIALPALPVP